MYYELTDSFIVKSDLKTTWDFFCKAENLPKITPAWMKFTILTPQPIDIKQDTLIDYTIHWFGIPLGWRTLMLDWSPQRQFIDLQLRGPYSFWQHQHTFTPCEEGTICTDRVLYQLPLKLFGGVMNNLIIKPQLLEIFEYRRKMISKDLGWVRGVQDQVSIRKIK